MAHIGNSGTGCALLTAEAETDVGLDVSASAGGGKSPRS